MAQHGRERGIGRGVRDLDELADAVPGQEPRRLAVVVAQDEVLLRAGELAEQAL